MCVDVYFSVRRWRNSDIYYKKIMAYLEHLATYVIKNYEIKIKISQN